MGALRAKSILSVVLVGFLPLALATDGFVLNRAESGWTSFYLSPNGTELMFILEPDLEGTGSFGVDLYSATDGRPTAVRVNLDGGGYALEGEVVEQDFELAIPDVPVLGGTGGMMSVSGNNLGCSSVQMTAYLTMQRYEIALRNCTSLEQPLRGIAYGAYRDEAGYAWSVVAGSGSTFEIYEIQEGSYSLTAADFEGTALHAEVPFAEVLYAPSTNATIGSSSGFTGSFIITGAPGSLNYSYESPTSVRRCSCASISEIASPGPRRFLLNATDGTTISMFVLAGVDARLPP